MARPATSTSRLLAGSREPCRVASTADIPSASGLLTIDGVTLEPGDRVLVKDQADDTQNGIYGASAGEWYRASDARSARAINKGVTVHVQEGAANAGKVYAFQTLDPVIGSDDIQVSFFISDDMLAGVEDEVEQAKDEALAEIEDAKDSAVVAVGAAGAAAIAEAAASADSAAASADAAAGSAANAQSAMTQAQLAAMAAGAPLYTSMPVDFDDVESPFLLSSANGVAVYTHDGATATLMGWLGSIAFVTVAELLASTFTLGPTAQLVEAGGFRYQVAASGAVDHHVTTAGGAKLYYRWTGEVNVQAFGAVGDGLADDTAAIQTALDTLQPVVVPKPPVTYQVGTLVLQQGQMVRGHSQFGEPLVPTPQPFTLTGNGTDPVLLIGNGTGDPRMITIADLSITNDGAPCVVADTAPNLIIERCRLSGTGGAHALDMRLCYRCAVRDSFISAGGGGTALRAMNNMNGMVIDNCTVTGGTAGRAMQIGMSQGIRITGNIVESSLDGIWISSTGHADDGNCNGVTIHGNYFEQIKTPLMLAKQFTILGLHCTGNYIGNENTTVQPLREAAIQFGRIKDGLISDNSIYVLNGVEDVFWIWLENAAHGFERLTVDRNYVQNTPANVYQFKGAFGASGSVKQAVGGTCNFQFMGVGNPLGSEHVQEWISPTIDGAVGWGTRAWLEDGRIAMGGTIRSIDVIDWDGGVLTGVGLNVGRTAVLAENVLVADMGTLTFTQGIAPVTLATNIILDGSDRVYRVVTAGGATGKFRIRIRYRAN